MARWDAFISYAHVDALEQMTALQRALERVAKPWFRRRALSVFRDTATMGASSSLQGSLNESLGQADWLVVALSPGAAQSHWVNEEVAWWLANRSYERILFVHVAGHVAWDGQGHLTADTDCVPPALRGVMAEPRLVDLTWFEGTEPAARQPKLLEAAGLLASSIRGIPQADLMGEDARQHRKALRLARGAVGALSVLLILSIVASTLAVRQRNDLAEQAVGLRAREMAAKAESVMGTDLRSALLLATAAYRLKPSDVTKSALMKVSLSSPHLKRFVGFDSDVTMLQSSPDGKALAVGEQSGRVSVVNPDAGDAKPILEMGKPIVAVAVANGGREVLGATKDAVWFRKGTAEPMILSIPEGSSISAVALKPDASTALVGLSSPAQTSFVYRFGLGDGTIASLPVEQAPRWISVEGSKSAVVQDTSNGAWARIQLSNLRVVAQGKLTFSQDHRSVGRPDPSGALFPLMWWDQGVATEVYRTPSADGEATAALVAPAPVPSGLSGATVSTDGSRVLTSGVGGLHAVKTAANDKSPGDAVSTEAPITVTGVAAPASEQMTFLGANNSRFGTANGPSVAVWDLAQVGRTSQQLTFDFSRGGQVSDPPSISIAPDGRTALVSSADRNQLATFALPLDGKKPRLAKVDPDQGLVDWVDGQTVLRLVGTSDPGLGDRLGVRVKDIDGSAWAGTSRRIVNGELIGLEGNAFRRRDVSTGAVKSEVALSGLPQHTVHEPIDDAGTHVAVNDGTAVLVFDLTSGQQIAKRPVASGPNARMSFLGEDLLVVDDSRAEAVADFGRGTVRSLDGVTSRYFALPTQGGDSLMVPGVGGTALHSRATGAFLATVGLPGRWEGEKHNSALSRDGRWLIVHSELPDDYTHSAVLVTDLGPSTLLDSACTAAQRDFSPERWQTLLGRIPEAAACPR